jgi:hypothetical protein
LGGAALRRARQTGTDKDRSGSEDGSGPEHAGPLGTRRARASREVCHPGAVLPRRLGARQSNFNLLPVPGAQSG